MMLRMKCVKSTKATKALGWTSMALVIFLFLLFTAAGSDKPNILFVFLDDFGWRDTGYMGSDFYETPNLDELSRGGMVFSNAYSSAANCAPARASLLSGQYTPRHKIYNVGTKPRGRAEFRRLEHIPGVSTLDTNIKTWAHQIKGAGYTTATMGKWHLSQDPIPYGFDLNVGGDRRGGPPQGYYPPFPDAKGLEEEKGNRYVTDVLSERAVSFIEKNAEKPWFLYLTHFAVHTPLNSKKELLDKYGKKTPGRLHNHVPMATMIQSVDDGVGMIMDKIKSLKLNQKTIVVFFSDNGGYGPATDMDPLKGYKGTYYEGGIRVPLFINWPGVTKKGSVSHEPVIGVDLYPTFCEMTGAKLPDNQPIDGKSLAPILKGEVRTFGDRPIYWHFPAYLQSYQVIDEQRDPLFRSRPCSIVRVGNYKLHQYFEDGGLELYDLEKDISEQKNLSPSMPQKAFELLKLLEAWRKSVGADIPLKRNPKFDVNEETRAIKKALARVKKGNSR